MISRQGIRKKALDMLEKEEVKPEIVLISYEKWLRELIAKEIKDV